MFFPVQNFFHQRNPISPKLKNQSLKDLENLFIVKVFTLFNLFTFTENQKFKFFVWYKLFVKQICSNNKEKVELYFAKLKLIS